MITRLFKGNVNIENARESIHASDERINRLLFAKELDNNSKIDKAFVVDRGHKNGKEIHAVTENGIIYILNLRKYIKHYNSLITVLIARPNQVRRLYEACGLIPKHSIIENCIEHQKKAYNQL